MSSRAYAEDWIVYFGPVFHSFPLSPWNAKIRDLPLYLELGA